MYDATDFSHLLSMEGFSNALLNNHFTLYQGYVKNTNMLLENLSSGEVGTPEYNEMKRRFGWEWNGMRLHELYFGNLSKENKKSGNDSPLCKKMTDDFGSIENARKNFTQTAGMRGIGWVVMYYDKKADQLYNVWIDDHATNHLTGCAPLLVMDMWEHAFMIDYGLKKPDYMTAFIKNVDWEEVGKRYEAACKN
ncbi:MAG: Fe-Mn family superoxide dismutase [Patescibacteria group bacterium]